METNKQKLFELIQSNIDSRVKSAIEESKEEAIKTLNDKLDQIAVDVAIDMQQSNLLNEMAQEIRLVIQTPNHD